MRHKAAEVETGEGNSVLVALTEHVAYLMAILDMKSSSLGNQINKEGQQSRANGAGNQGLGNNKRNGDHQNDSSTTTQSLTPGNQRTESQVQ